MSCVLDNVNVIVDDEVNFDALFEMHSASNAFFAVKIDLCSCRELFIQYFISN